VSYFRIVSVTPTFFLAGCDVKTRFRTEQLSTKYIWVWGSLCFMALIYTVIFAVMREWVIVENGVWYWYRNYDADQPAQGPEEDKPAQGPEEENDIAKIFLL